MNNNCSLAGYMLGEYCIILRLMYFLILIDVLLYIYMHNNYNYQCKICWIKAMTFGVGSIQLSFRTIVFTQNMQRCFQSKCYYFSVKLCRGFALQCFSLLLLTELQNCISLHTKYSSLSLPITAPASQMPICHKPM